jgi:hypothetical protein
MMTGRLPAAIAALFAFVLAATASLAADDKIAARVIDYDGDTGSYQVLRDSKTLNVWYFMPLLNGDRVVVAKPGVHLVIRYVDSRVVEITTAPKPYPVQSAAVSKNPISAFAEALLRNMTRETETVRRNSRTRGTCPPQGALRLAMAGLSGGTARIASGARYPMLQWVGGACNFHVVIGRPGEKPLVDEDGIDTRQLIINSHTVTFTPGRYEITVTDAEMKTVHGAFTAVDSGIPSLPADGIDDAEVHAVVSSAALMDRHDPTLAYEAYLRLHAGLAKQNKMAEDYAEWIAVGAPKP